MNRRERGAAVNVMWVIFLLVILLGAGGWIYSRESEVADARNQAAQAKQDAQAAIAAVQEETRKLLELSGSVGFRANPNANSASTLIEDKLSQVRGRFPNDMTASDDTTLEAVIDRLVVMVDARAQKARDAEQSFGAEKGKRQSAESAKNDVESSLNSQIAQVNTDLRDARDLAQSSQQSADDRAAGLQDQVDSMQSEVRSQESDFNRQRSELEREKDQLSGRIVDLSRKTDLIGVDTAPNDPDGEVVAVGRTTGLVFMDIGSQDLLRRGVRFDVFRWVKGGELVPKGVVEVREVADKYSVAGIVEEFDKYDPISAGDVVANPHFSREREKVFVLLGDFPVFGRAFIEKRLVDLGAEVEPGVTNRVDFLVLGEKSPDESAPELTETEEYKRAREFGVHVMRVRDIARFIEL